MLNWQGWAANFLGWGGEGVATPATPPQQVGGGGRRIWFEVWKNVPLYEAETEPEARKVVKTIKRHVVRKARQALKAGLPMPPLPEIKATGEADFLQAIVRDATAEMRAVYQRLWDEIDEDDIEVLLLND